MVTIGIAILLFLLAFIAIYQILDKYTSINKLFNVSAALVGAVFVLTLLILLLRLAGVR